MSQIKTTLIDQMPVIAIKGIGNALAQTLAKLNIHTVQDILFHLPSRYLDRTKVTPIGQVQNNNSVVLEGEVSGAQVVLGKRRSLAISLKDHSGIITLRFYHFNAAQKAALKAGTKVRCYGDTHIGRSGLELYHPEYSILDPTKPDAELDQSLTPVYSLTDGISQNRMRKIAEAATRLAVNNPPEELLPAEFNQRFKLNSLGEALQYLHRPPKDAAIDLLVQGTHPFQMRLAFEELLAHHLTLKLSRAKAQKQQAPSLLPCPTLSATFYNALPFKPTTAQTRVINDIQTDVAKTLPMLRLVQGDVGSGKTLVAAAAALCALNSGYQAALAAPTEILAEQHRLNFELWLEPLGFSVVWLVGKLTAKKRALALEAIASHQAQMIIGTHALFQDDVEFAKLGLVIIDEQHRFGVHQRLSLRNKAHSTRPHQLVMTATPIPRTLAMTAYSDLDISVIDELPPGRTPITTVLISQDRKDQVTDRIKNACQEGRQAYWVCTLVEDSETLSASAAEVTAETLRESLPNLNIGLVHGRMKAKDKEAAMTAFKNGETHLLVATTVIEVGVDVPNASLMIIENPERLGLAQLHQLRGRVGRGEIASFCVLMYGSPLSQIARKRLQVLRDTNDGFVIAEEDLAIRGPGELLGTRQTGELNFRLADIQRDAHLIPSIQSTADLIERHNSHYGTKIIKRWFANHTDYLHG